MTIRVILIGWLVIASVLLFAPAAALLFSASKPATTTTAPAAPPAPTLEPLAISTDEPKELLEERGKAYATYINAQVSRYENEVAAYKEHVAAVKEASDAAARADRVGIYALVVKDTLSSLVNGLIVALTGFVFIKAGGDAAAKYQSAKRGT